ncbi:DUF6328 family protein [Streptomyces sp. NPDC003023]|uniref:DUF6328 family protein n=1 Tax=Streptomyces sp. NPDC003023 TaxID=3364675 RepID=UPI0036C8246F
MGVAHTGPGGRREDEDERFDRLWAELLREVRVALAGVQLVFVFLLAVAFAPGFARLGEGDRTMYVASLLVGVAATGLLTAPVGIHRVVTGRGLKYEAVKWSSRLTVAGLVLLLCLVGLAVLIVLRSVATLSDTTALVMTLAVVGGLTLSWLVPAVLMSRRSALVAGAAQDEDEGPHDPVPDGEGRERGLHG